ncbi:PCNA-associated factor-like [Prorops nasuta]|uniref:PCNA-associated factor-like n=1 Tax=Prorops nasuta TaxID=863751 RepID=UPI0034CD3DDC
MVRTKADRVAVKAVGSKAPRKIAATTPSKRSGGSKGKNYSGGNPYHPRDTPEWQKPITNFLNQTPNANGSENQPSSSKEVGQNRIVNEPEHSDTEISD